MTRKRRASTRAGRTSEVTQADVQEDSKEHTLRRTKRVRRSTQKPNTLVKADAISEEESSETKGQVRQRRSKRSSSSTPARGRRGRKSTPVTLFDPDADPGEELDPTVVTMAAICDDTGQGRVSSKAALIQRNHQAWKAANKQKRDRMRLIMEAKKYGRNEDETSGPVETPQAEKKGASDDDGSRAATPVEAPTVEDANGFNYREALPVSRFSAQVRIGPNGETIIDEESLFVERTENADDGTDAYQHVEESDQTKFTNSASYGRKLRGSRWSAEETELFYDALSQFGENYELISYVIPGRDRKACKAKFKAEDKKNPNRITYCLKNRTPYDIETLSRLTGKDFSGPTPEIIAPVKPSMVDEPQELQQPHSEAESSTQIPRKKSKTPGLPDDVEVVGDIESFDGKESDD
ncbi:uncharacterized protein FOMMEDRAFT_105727 [Fomitiporia mediterranea MF3/22]|uniref:uncharacterized protein n=1 Tax=Fomitiporia mediterranea (strain MF3/22) TaxID=694068 RepID=UPI00044091D9|nr:uncharacterized protein FOMMEDRAFT_105727 [Fomitiporia mediterranea MF3/22]EJD03632.1 hypothetical protein FOMMEDRAFT_105727 [Fomitiporia mediterranea MF3/22]